MHRSDSATPSCGRRTVLRRFGAAGLTGTAVLGGCTGRAKRVRTTTFVLRTATDGASTSPTPGSASTATPTPTPSDDRDEYRLLKDGLRWETVPVGLVVGSSTIPDGVSTPAAKRALVGATETWNGVANTPTVFSPPTFDDSIQEVTGGNRTNEFVWASLDGDTVGETTVHWEKESGRLVEVDVRLDRDYPWATRPTGTEDPELDVRSIATHELGHHGLADVTGSEASEQTMYAYAVVDSTRKRTLGAGDVTGWQVVYGERTPSPVGTETET
ncbi:MAG: matrixin family metalloprotease [Haloferacaceae archaeon]